MERDKRVWVGEKSGSFSCKSYFELLINLLDDALFVPYKTIWKVGIPPKVKVFAWLASWKKVNTYDLLQIRRPYLLSLRLGVFFVKGTWNPLTTC